MEVPNSSNPSATPVSNSASSKARVLRFGYQKSNILLKTKGVLEKRLSPDGISVEWIEFPAGPQLLEAMNVGSIDFGHIGESPPVFAQAAGASLYLIFEQNSVHLYSFFPVPSPQSPVPNKESLTSTSDSEIKSDCYSNNENSYE